MCTTSKSIVVQIYTVLSTYNISVHPIHEDPIISGSFLRGNQYHNDEFVSLVKLMNNQDLILVDIGANIGSLSLLSASNNIDVIAFEPNPFSYEKLKESICLNKFQNKITLFPFGISNTVDYKNIYISKDKTRHSMASFHKKYRADTKRVRLYDGDTFLPYLIKNKKWLLKIDTEGFEMLTIQGLQKTFEMHPPELIHFEYFPLLLNVSKKNFQLLLNKYFDCKLPNLSKKDHTNVLCHKRIN